MKIAVNTRLLLPNNLEGIGWFTYEVFKRLSKNHPEIEWVFIFDRAYDPSFVFFEKCKTYCNRTSFQTSRSLVYMV